MNPRSQYTFQFAEAKQAYQTSSIQVSPATDINNPQALFSKGLPHPDQKTPLTATFQQLVSGIQNKNIGQITSVANANKKLVDPYTVVDKEIIGKFKSSYRLDPTPSPFSAQASAELLEVYAMALLRDIPFHQWTTLAQDSSSVVSKVLSDLNSVKQHLNGPTINGQITVKSLFRGPCPGELKGPLVSQFLYQPIQLGSLYVEQKYECPSNLKNYMTDVSGFLHIWNGGNPSEPIILKGDSRYLITIRDCANYIHLDQMWQPFFMTGTWLLSKIPIGFTCTQRSGAKFISLGPIDLFDIMMNATKLAMNSAWVWKWTQMKMRPEEFAYQVHLKKTNPAQGLNFHSILSTDNHEILNLIHDLSQNYLLPQAYPEGSPGHPSYPAGHAVIAGAMCTILKAWFDCTATFPNPKIPNVDGSGLVAFTEETLNVGDELDKMASNCGIFRNFAGIHYRSDMNAGILLGEMIAIDLLQDFVGRYANQVQFTIKKRNGNTIFIKNY